LLLDEAMAGLDATEIEEVVSLIKSVRDRGVTIVIIEHVLQAILGQ
jgi:branched-chain amino acid transport system ATP-binding protein